MYKKHTFIAILAGLCIASAELTQSTAKFIKKASGLAVSTGAAVYNAPKIVEQLNSLKKNILGKDGLIQSVKNLQDMNNAAIIDASNTTILIGITTSYIMQQAIIALIQSLPINDLLLQAGSVGKKTADIFTDILNINNNSANILGNTIAKEIPEILQTVTMLVDRFSNRFIKLSSFFQSLHSPSQPDFLQYTQKMLHEGIDQSIEKVKKLDAGFKKELGITNISELDALAQSKDFSVFHNQGGKIRDFVELAAVMKEMFSQSATHMLEYSETLTDISQKIQSIIQLFEKETGASSFKKIVQGPRFIKELCVPIEGITLTTILCIHELCTTTKIAVEACNQINTLFETVVISEPVLTEISELLVDGDLIIKSVYLLSNLISSDEAPELAFLRIAAEEKVQNKAERMITIKPIQKESMSQKKLTEETKPTGGKQFKALQKWIPQSK